MSMSTSKPVPVPSQPESAITPRSRPRTKVRQPLGRLGVLTSAIASKAPRTVFTVISSPTSPFMPPSVQILTSGEPAKQVTPKPKSKEKERKPRSSHRSQVERLKTIVRRLPPNLPEDVFWQSVQPWVTEETVTWKVYYQGKFRKRFVYLSVDLWRGSAEHIGAASIRRTRLLAHILRSGARNY